VQEIHRDITSDFKSLAEFLTSCDCLEELPLFEKAKVRLKSLPTCSIQDLMERVGLPFGSAKEIYDALKPYRPATSNNNPIQVCVL
jgi:hypothetical protein